MRCQNHFSVPGRLDPKSQAVVSLWQRLKRAENGMPFSDDLGQSALSSLGGLSFLLGVFAAPERFRLEFLGAGLQGAAAAGKFIDEIPQEGNFSYLRAQASATLEAAEPTWLRLGETSGRSFSRLLLPMWGNGQINMLLGTIEC